MKLKHLTYLFLLIILYSCAAKKTVKKTGPEKTTGQQTEKTVYFKEEGTIPEKDLVFPLQSSRDYKYKNIKTCRNHKIKYAIDEEPTDSLDQDQNQWWSSHLLSLNETKLYNQTGKGLKIIRYTFCHMAQTHLSLKLKIKMVKLSGPIRNQTHQAAT